MIELMKKIAGDRNMIQEVINNNPIQRLYSVARCKQKFMEEKSQIQDSLKNNPIYSMYVQKKAMEIVNKPQYKVNVGEIVLRVNDEYIIM